MNYYREHWRVMLHVARYVLAFNIALFLGTLPWASLTMATVKFAAIGAVLAFAITALQIRTGFWCAPLSLVVMFVCERLARGSRTAIASWATEFNFLGLMLTFWFALLLTFQKRLLRLIGRLEAANPAQPVTK